MCVGSKISRTSFFTWGSLGYQNFIENACIYIGEFVFTWICSYVSLLVRMCFMCQRTALGVGLCCLLCLRQCLFHAAHSRKPGLWTAKVSGLCLPSFYRGEWCFIWFLRIWTQFITFFPFQSPIPGVLRMIKK